MEAQSFTSAGVVEDTRRGLMDSPKWLSSLYFYDRRGSLLFERICSQPEYYPTRTEATILRDHGSGILEAAGDGLLLAELGSGSSTKTRILIPPLLQRQGPSVYVPVDVSEAFLKEEAARLQKEFPGLAVHPVAAEYGAGLAAIAAHDAARRLVLFLGSSIGNFEPPEQQDLLGAVRRTLNPGDTFLLGTDLVKDPAVLEAAYNDAAGTTEAFNKNLLHHLDRLLGGRHDPDGFRHVAVWNPQQSRIEMHLESTRDQVLHYPEADLEVPLREGERIHTENSYKFTVDQVQGMAQDAGLEPVRCWQDAQQWFALHLLRVPG